MSVRYSRNKSNEITPVKFTQSPEIGYWAKKYNLTTEELEKAFVESNFSINKALAICLQKNDN